MAILLAAGSGDRLGRGGPKAFESLAGRPLLEFSLSAMGRCPGIAAAVLVVPAGMEEAARDLNERVEPRSRLHAVVPGGPTRQASVRLGLEAVPSSVGMVVCHDAARPFASPGLFDRVL